MMGYKASLEWIIDNDDTEWLLDDVPIPCVTAILIADIFDKEVDKVIKDLKKMLVERK